MGPSLQLELDSDERRAVVALSGEVDIATAPRLRHSIDRAVPWEEVDELTLDLRGLDFMDSSGLSALIWLHKQHPGTAVKLMVMRDSMVRRLFEVTSMSELFDIEVVPQIT